MRQEPAAESYLLKWRGDTIKVTLTLDSPRAGRAALRSNIGHARIRRREIIAENDRGETPMARAWADIPLAEVAPGVFSAEVPLEEVGVFSGKTCFFPEGSDIPEWAPGRNFHIKVESAYTRKNNSIYTVFPRQFGSFREVARRLGTIMDEMGFRIIQTLPPFPVPTTYAAMGEYGCPFAALDFHSVDPAMAEFDDHATPLDQFRELVDAVHAKNGLFFIDLPANHTGWASTLQTQHPDWFQREADGKFISPGAWGVVWADLVALDYQHPALRAYMAEVFLFWCRKGVDGFRCDAGYMIPMDTWTYIVARVREEYPDTVFMLEGLGGKLETTDALLAEANLDWAYSEIFQTYTRDQFSWYLPQAIERSERYGTLVHFAETHDNDRLAKKGEVYARLRVQLAALLSWQGAWGIANGVEWYCKEKIDVHGKNGLNWGAQRNMVDLIARLNRILAEQPAFQDANHLELVTEGGGDTLAVLRDGILVLANLDTKNPVEISWRRDGFDVPRGYDLLTERFVNTSGAVALKPGEVLCLQPAPTVADIESMAADRDAFRIKNATHVSDFASRPSLVHWEWPRDARRDVVIPEEQYMTVSAPYPFRACVNDPSTGKTLRAYRSRPVGEGRFSVRFDGPHYKGDGTRCRKLELLMTVFRPEGPKRTISTLMVPPRTDVAAVQMALDGAGVRAHPEYRTVLSNGAGAAAQARVGWGRIASQYDATLAANVDAACPSERLNLWTRTRCWLQREGYVREFDLKTVTGFTADPAGRFAEWKFFSPCGMGKAAAFTVTMTLAEGANAARISVERTHAGRDEVGGSVRLVFRPDLEWRSFHATTKAYQGAERDFPRGTRVESGAIDFSPYPDQGTFRLEVAGGECHGEAAWVYNEPHAEEAARGQEPSGDLYSPAWISADLELGDTVTLTGSFSSKANPLPRELSFPRSNAAVDLQPKMAFDEVLRRSLDLYIVKRDDLKTVIAGYPWFLDWGRDTFIFMRGMIAAGKIEDSVRILKAFAAFEENGTLPNIIYGKTAGNRDTTDAQLWFIRCVQEVEEVEKVEEVEEAEEVEEVEEAEEVRGGNVRGGKARVRKEDLQALRKTCESIVDHYISGTPNGIKVDRESGLVWSPSHFTWMDTNYPACTPRIGYPVEIQALWISALKYLGRDELAGQALDSVKKYFKIPAAAVQPSTLNLQPVCGYYDCLAAPNGEPASRAKPEDTVRPNQLFLITLGILEDKSILDATEQLLVPGGIRSLNSEHPLYKGKYEGDEDTRRKPAYHNGTVWAWPFPLYAEALAMTGTCARQVAIQFLTSAVENLNDGCIGHLSEVADGDAPHAQKGCTAQAWSDSEVLRVWLKLAKSR